MTWIIRMTRKLPWISEHFLLNRQFEHVDDVPEETGEEEEEDEEMEAFKLEQKTIQGQKGMSFLYILFQLGKSV